MENLYLMGFIGLIGVGLGAWGHETLKKKWPESEILYYAINTYLLVPWIGGAFWHDYGWGAAFLFLFLVPLGWGHGLFLFFGLTP